MAMLISILSGWGMCVSLLIFCIGCFFRWRKGSCAQSDSFMSSCLLWGQRPVRVLIYGTIFCVFFIFLLVLAFAPGHAALWGCGLGVKWPWMPFRWADGLSVALLLAAMGPFLRHLLLKCLREETEYGAWWFMVLLILVPCTGLLTRASGSTFFLLLHLITVHVLLWWTPHCRCTRLLN